MPSLQRSVTAASSWVVLLSSLSLAPVSAARPAASTTASGTRPYNILFLPADDLKPLLGCYGDKFAKTPHIDRLAARGTIFRNNHCQQAVCGPTRASLMTGMYPDHTRVWDLNTRMRDVHPDLLTLPQYLRQHGYTTTSIGKTYDFRCVDDKGDEPSWSIPEENTDVPSNAGLFEIRHFPAVAARKGTAATVTPEATAARLRALRAVPNGKGDRGPSFHRPAFLDDDVSDLEYVDGQLAEYGSVLLAKFARSGQPFFLSVGFMRPHLPFIAPKRYWDLYDPATLPLSPYQEHAANSPDLAYHNSAELRFQYSDIPDLGPLSPKLQRQLIHGYYASVSYVDAQVGKLLDQLDALGLADNTIVCLWGDHGWHLGDHGLWCKHTNFEQATRSPLIISAPGKPRGLASDSPTGFIDVFPTLCGLAGLPIPGHLQGRNLMPLWDDPNGSVREAILSQYPRSIGNKPVMGYALRSKRYRYVKWLQIDFRQGERAGPLVATELYDYEKDPHESASQAANPDYTAVVAQFETLFRQMDVAQHKGLYR